MVNMTTEKHDIRHVQKTNKVNVFRLMFGCSASKKCYPNMQYIKNYECDMHTVKVKPLVFFSVFSTFSVYAFKLKMS